MSPGKLFRRYSRTVVLVVMSLLLVVFLIEPALQARGMFSGSGFLVGEAFGERVYTSHLEKARQDLTILNAFGMFLVPADNEESLLAAYLLMREAEKLGIRLGAADIEKEILAAPPAAAAAEQLRDRHNLSLRSICEALARGQAVLVAHQLQFHGAVESVPRLKQEFRDRFQRADLHVAVLDARAFERMVAEPTDAEIQAAFEEGKNRFTSHTADTLMFGYREGERVRVEYLTIDPEKLVSRVRVTERDARRHYEANRSLYVVGGDKPLAFEELTPDVQQRVREEARQAEAIVKAQSLVNRLAAEARRSGNWDGAPRDEQGYRVSQAPEGGVSFEALAQRYANEAPVEFRRTELINPAGLIAEPGLPQARLREGQTMLTAEMLVGRVKGLYTPMIDERAPVLNLFEPSPVLTRPATAPQRGQQEAPPYQAYLLRVVEAVPSGPPSSLDAVRGTVRADLKRARAWELVGERARQIAEQARQAGLQAAVDAETDLLAMLRQADEAEDTTYLKKLGPSAQSAARMFAAIPSLGMAGRDFAAELFEMVDQQDAAATQGTRQVVVAPAAMEFCWAVAEVARVRPLYEGDFARMQPQLRNANAGVNTRMLMQWLDPANVLQRTGFKRAEAQ